MNEKNLTNEEKVAFIKAGGSMNTKNYIDTMEIHEADDQDEIISSQRQIINEYEETLKFLNKVCLDCVRHQRTLKEQNSEEFNEDLMSFVWETNDHIADLLIRCGKLKDKSNEDD